MGARNETNARSISDLDQRLAALQHVREIVEGNTTRLVQAIAQANAESFDQAEQAIRDEEAAILRAERGAGGE